MDATNLGERRPLRWRDARAAALIAGLALVSLSLIWLVDRFDPPELTTPAPAESPEAPQE